MPPNANASMPPCTPADFASDMAASGSGHADTINPYPTRSACFADLRDHAVRLMNRRGGHHCLCGRCDRQGKSSNSDQFKQFRLSSVRGSKNARGLERQRRSYANRRWLLNFTVYLGAFLRSGIPRHVGFLARSLGVRRFCCSESRCAKGNDKRQGDN